MSQRKMSSRRASDGGGLDPVINFGIQSESGRSTKTQWRQWLACISATLTMVVVGTVYGWTTTSLLHLTQGTGDVPIMLTHDESSWVVSLTVIGSMIGPFMAAYLVDRTGRKYCLLLSSTLFTMGWFIIYSVTTVTALYIARMILGIGVGIAYTINPMYVSEVADINIRGALGTLIAVNVFTGSLLTCTLGLWLTYNSLLKVLISIPFISFLSISWFPDTPYFLAAKGRRREACKAITFFKGITDPQEIKIELAALYSQSRSDSRSQPRSDSRSQSSCELRSQSSCELRSQSSCELRSQPTFEFRSQPTFEFRSQPTFELQPEPGCELHPEPRCELHPEPRCELHPEPRCELHPEPRCELHPEPRCELHPEPRCELHPEPRCELHPEPKCELHPEPECELHSQSKIDLRPQSRSDLRSLSRSDLRSLSRSDLRSKSRSDSRSQARSDVRSQTISDLVSQSKSGSRSRFDSLRSSVSEDETRYSWRSKLRLILQPSNRGALLIMIGLVMAQQLSGNFSTMQYLEVLFSGTTIGIKPNIATILVLAVGLISGILSTLTVESAGRRTLLILSTLGSCVTLFTLAIYLYLAQHNYDVSMISLLPVIDVIIYQVMYQIGLGTLPNALIGELFPTEVKGVAGAIITISDGIIGFVVSKLYQVITDIAGSYSIYLIFATSCCLAFLMVFIWVPETKGKTYREIEALLLSKKLVPSSEQIKIKQVNFRI